METREGRKRVQPSRTTITKPPKEEPKKEPKKSSKASKKSVVKSVPKTTVPEGSLFPAYEKESTYLCELFDKLIEKNHSNSILISGDSGVGKTTLVESCLAKYPTLTDVQSAGSLSRRQSTSQYSASRQLKAVIFRFDGHLHGRNEPALLRQIGKRLNEFFDKDEQIFVDDLDETFEGHEDDEDAVVSMKVSRSIPKIMDLFRRLVDKVPTFRAVIILDQFEMFCTKHQHLLYNLFDLIQYGKGVLIIGITRVLECHQLLIARVQSRLSQRYIHLSSALDTVDKYKAFCQHEVRALGPEFQDLLGREGFDGEVKKNFSISKSFADAKKFVLQAAFVPKFDKENTARLGNVALRHDTKMIDILHLTRNELIILIVANRSMRTLGVEVFNPRDLYQWTVSVQQVKQLKFQQLIKAVYSMLESDLLIYAKEVKKAQLALTPWTKLKLNISDFQLKEMAEKMASGLPTYLKQLIN